MPRKAILSPASIPSWFTFVIHALDWIGRGSAAMTLFGLLTSKGALLIAFLWLLALAFVPDKWRSAVGRWLTRHGWKGEPEDVREEVKILDGQLSREKKAREDAEHELKGVQQDLSLCDDSRKREVQQLQSREGELARCKLELERVESEREGLQRVNKERRIAWLQRLLSDCGHHEPEPKKHSVVIQYVHPDDVGIARQIREHFIHEDSRNPWAMAPDADQVMANGTRRNSSESADIVVFYDEPQGHGMARAIQELTGRRTTKQPSRPDKEADVEVVIFGHRKVYD